VAARSLSVLCILLTFLPGAGSAEGSPGDRVTIAAIPPVVAVTAGAPGRQFVELPTLEYSFEVTAQCSDSRTPQSLSINVADSRISLSPADLAAEAPRAFVLKIPGRQIAPVAVDDFCVLDDGNSVAETEDMAIDIGPVAAEPEPRLLTVGAALSAQASLVCGSGDGERHITYVSRPLDVTLSCPMPAAREADRLPAGAGEP
jgi:hypothetical protein